MSRRGSRTVPAALAFVMVALCAGAAHAAVTGTIRGTVVDETSRRPIAGVTVSVSSPALQGEQTEFTDSGGRYVITELPPGDYVVRFYFSNVRVERGGIRILADTTLNVDAALPTQKAETQVYKIVEKAPTVDVGNTQIQTQITSELVKNTPVNGTNGRRTFDSVLTLAPGTATDPVGYTFNGATGPENAYLIDGLNTTQPAFGLLGTQLTIEFLGETEVVTAGYNAEYGRATGGVVNAVTKTGSNNFHGGAWFYYTPFSLDPELLARSGEAITAKTKLKYAFDFGFDLGGPIVKDRIWFYVGFAPTFTSLETTRVLRTRTANNLDPAMSSGTYAGDIDKNARCPDYIRPELCTSGGFITQNLDSKYNSVYATDRVLYNWIAKLNFQLTQNNSLSVSYIGSPNTVDGAIAGPLGTTLNNGGPGARLGSQSFGVHDVLLHYISKLFSRHLQIDINVGYHVETRRDTPDAAHGGNAPVVIDQRTRPLTQFEPDVTPCNPQMIHGVTFNPCTVSNYVDGGFGFTQEWTTGRIVAAASATLFGALAGTHALKLGGDFEDNSFRRHRYYTGAPNGGRYRIRPSGAVNRTQFGTVANPDAPRAEQTVNVLQDGFNPTTTTYSEALYLRDSWNVGFAPGLTLNAGVRWELEQVRGDNGTNVISLTDNIAPRLGFIWDYTRRGLAKLYGSYGRYYESIPLDINDRQFSGEGLIGQTFAPALIGCTVGPTGRYDVSTCQFPTPTRNNVNGGEYSKVSPVLKGQYTNELLVGVQQDVGLDLVLGVSYAYRNLGRIIEDISPDGGATYIIANPGDPTDPAVVKDLQDKIAKETDPKKKAELQTTLTLYRGVESFSKPKRDNHALTLTAVKRLTHHFIVQASYTYSRTFGNYPGLFSQNNGQLDPNISSQYDLRELLVNRDGPLPNDRPHNLKVLGSYFVPLGEKAQLVLGLNFNALSGRPIEVLGSHPIYGPNESFILPRGSGGRTPTLTSLDLHVAYSRQIGNLIHLDIYWDTFNVINQHAIASVDDTYSLDNVNPIENGTVADLKNLKNTSGQPARLNPNYGNATAFQQPLSMRFGLRVSF